MLSLIPESNIIAQLVCDNPWWQHQQIHSEYQDYPRRIYLKKFYSLIQDDVSTPIVLTGQRHIGKTMMVYHTIDKLLSDGINANQILVLSLNNPAYTSLTLSKILQLFQDIHQNKAQSVNYIFLDDIQYLKDWQTQLDVLIAENPSHRYTVIGSATNDLDPKLSRHFFLPVLTFSEYLLFNYQAHLVPYSKTRQQENIIEINKEFTKYLNYGTYPELAYNSDEQKINTKKSTLQSILQWSLPSLYGISNTGELNKLFATLAYNTGSEISLESLAQSAGVSKLTVKKYLNYFQSCFLIKVVSRLDLEAKSFQRATTFKIYLTNTALYSMLFGFIEPNNTKMESIVETAIISQYPNDNASLYYSRWQTGGISIAQPSLEQQPARCADIGWSKPKNNDNLIAYAKQNNLSTATITTENTSQTQTIDGVEIESIPAALYVYQVGQMQLN